MGMDSLIVINLTRLINQSLKSQGQGAASPTLVYENPSLQKLRDAILAPPRKKEYSDFDSDDEDDKATWIEMEEKFQQLRGLTPGQARKAKRNILRSSRPPPLFQPDGGLIAWIQVLGAFLVNLNNWGLVNSFGVYQAYYETQLLTSHSPSTIS